MANALIEPQGFTITDHQLVDRLAPLARLAIQWQEDLTHLNRMGGLEWGERERLRTIQGLFDKIEDACSDLIWGVGDDYAATISESIWGAVDLDDV